MLSDLEEEKLVIHLYYNQLNNVRQIAQEGGMSLRFTAILKKKEEATVNHGWSESGNENGMVAVENQRRQQSNDCNNSPQWKLYDKRKAVEMAIQLILLLKSKQPNIIKDTGD